MSSTLESEFDPAICWQAISARDRRFDGRFYVGVVTTKVYCRPICPIPLRKPENVKWFQSAASAEVQGYRPCRRCRPDTSPGTPAWHGTLAVVSRALRLIQEGALDRGNVEDLAERVGLGSRHLRRLFAKHLGAAPNQIAGVRRLRLARQLLKDTGWSVRRVAFSSGFRSIRQFNHAVRSSFRQSPSGLRRGGNPIDLYYPENEICLRLPFRPPFDWPAMLRFFKQHSTPGVEVVDDRCYRRTIQVGGAAGCLEVTSDARGRCLVSKVRLDRFDSLIPIAQRVRRLFDLDADPLQISHQLGRDGRLRPLLAKHPGLRVPGAWDVFELAVLTILGQRLGRRANAMAVRLIFAFGRSIETSVAGLTHLFPEPQVLAEADLAGIGLKPATAEAIRVLAAGLRDNVPRSVPMKGASSFAARTLAPLGLSEAISQYIAMRGFAEPDAFPVSRRAIMRADARWRPWSAYAAMYLWIADAKAAPEAN